MKNVDKNRFDRGTTISFALLLLCSFGCRTVSSENSSVLNSSSVGGKSCPWKTSKDIVIPPQVFGEEDPERILTKEEINEDIACLIVLLDKQYAAGDYYKKLGQTVSMQDQARKIAENSGPISNYTLLSNIFDAVHKDAYDGHLRYWLRGDSNSGRAALSRASEHKTPYLMVGRVTNIKNGAFTFNYKDALGASKSIGLSRCDQMRIRKVTVNGTEIFDGIVGSFPTSSTGTRSVSCKTSDNASSDFTQNAIALKTPFVANSTGKRVTWEQKAGGILYVRIWEIGQRDQNGKWSPEQEQLLKVLMAIPSDQKLIIDYRGTGTGDSTFASLLARTLYSKSHPPTGPVGTQKMSLYTRAGQVSTLNQVVFNPAAFGSSTLSAADNITTRDQVQQLLDNLESRGYTMETMNSISINDASLNNTVSLRNTDLNKPILVITDGDCGSSCGMALAALRKHPMVKFIGNNSAGNLHFMSPGTFMLPRSRIKLFLSPTSFSYTPEFDDAAGFDADLYVVGADPVDAAIKYFEKL